MIGLPFTIAIVLLSIAMLISKFQDASTKFMVACYSMVGTCETGSLILTLVLYINNANSTQSVKILLILSLSLIYIINFLGFLILTPYLLSDRKFTKWANRRARREDCRFNLFWFHLINVFSFLTNYKLKMVVFSRLFSFNCFDGQLEDINKFKIFNVLSFIGLVPEVIFIYCGVVTIAGLDRTNGLFMPLVDALVIFVLNIILSMVVSKKEIDFFTEQLQGVSLNQIYNVADQQFQSGAIMMNQQKKSQQNRDVNRFKLEDISEYDEFAYRTTKRERKLKKREFSIHPNEEEVCQADNISSENTGNIESEREKQCELEEEERQPKQSPLSLEKIRTNNQHQPLPNIFSFRCQERANNTDTRQTQINQAANSIQQVVIFDQNLNDESEDYYSSRQNQEILGNRIAKPQHLVDLPIFPDLESKASEKMSASNADSATGLQVQTHIRLSDYLQANRQKQSKQTQIYNQLRRQDEALKSSQSQQLPKKNLYNHSKSLKQQQKDSLPVKTQPKQLTNQNAYNPVTSHMPIKKNINNDNNQKRGRLRESREANTKVGVNQNHEQKPIRSKSKQWVRNNYPISTFSSKNKFNLQLGRGRERESSNDDQGINQSKDKSKQTFLSEGRVLKEHSQILLHPEFAPNSLFMANFKSKAQFTKIPEQLSAINQIPPQPIQFLLSITPKQSSAIKERMRRKSNQGSEVYGRRSSSSGKINERIEMISNLKASKSCQKKMSSLQKIYLQKVQN